MLHAAALLRSFEAHEHAQPFASSAADKRAAHMHEATLTPTTTSEPAEGLEAAALRAQAWFGEPFLHAGEDPASALAPGTARRVALDDALAEIDAGRAEPSPRWKVRYGLMLGLERVLAPETPTTAAGTELRRHQIDALAGMLTELIAANQREAEENGNGSATATPRRRPSSTPSSRKTRTTGRRGRRGRRRGRLPGRRPRRRRGATASATRPRPARRSPRPASSRRPAHLGILILTHRRLLVSQFQRDLTTEGYGDRFVDAIEHGAEPPPRQPDHDPDVRVVRPARRLRSAAPPTSS